MKKKSGKKNGTLKRLDLSSVAVGPLQQAVKTGSAGRAPAGVTLGVMPRLEPGKKFVLLQVSIEEVRVCDRLLRALEMGKPLPAGELEAAKPFLQTILKGWLLA